MSRLRVSFSFPSLSGLFAQVALLSLLLWAIPGSAAPLFWRAMGPVGGDARAFAAVPGHPDHLYLGTTNSWLYESLNGGASWHRLAKLAFSDDFILDHIVVDRANSDTIYVAAWRLDKPDGGLWVSHNGGRSWSVVEGLRGQSIRAFAQAPSDPRMLFAGTLDGVYRSNDAGATWKLISPPKSQEIHEVESLAVDPVNPAVIYAGTWHLPWKSNDGGQSWHNIKQGVIDDSDVFSIIVDPVQTTTVYASACSGIYKSVNAAEQFKKVQGIPATARRTRVLKQDPVNRNVVYAGTTEGLYKSIDGGQSFKRMTGPEVIVNDIFVDPQDPNQVFLATDSSGVLLSRNAAASFVAANEGFSARKVEALLVDRDNPARLYAGVVNDKNYGGVFVSNDGGVRWRQIDEERGGGLAGRDVFVLAQSPQGTVLAGTNRGIFALSPGTARASEGVWSPRNTVQNPRGKKVRSTAGAIEGRVHALDLSSEVWLASTASGLFTSKNHGTSWQGGPVMGDGNYLSVAVHGPLMAAARWNRMVFSDNAGLSWTPVSLPESITRIYCVAFSADETLWLGVRGGLYYTHDHGKTWSQIDKFPLGDVDSLYYDHRLGKIFASSRASDLIFSVDPKSLEWKWSHTGYRIKMVRIAGERLLAASLHNGVLTEPPAAEAAATKGKKCLASLSPCS